MNYFKKINGFVHIHDFFEGENYYFLVLDYIEGKNLNDFLHQIRKKHFSNL